MDSGLLSVRSMSSTFCGKRRKDEQVAIFLIEGSHGWMDRDSDGRRIAHQGIIPLRLMTELAIVLGKLIGRMNQLF